MASARRALRLLARTDRAAAARGFEHPQRYQHSLGNFAAYNESLEQPCSKRDAWRSRFP